MNKVLDTNVYEMHTFLAHMIDKGNLKSDIRKRALAKIK